VAQTHLRENALPHTTIDSVPREYRGAERAATSPIVFAADCYARGVRYFGYVLLAFGLLPLVAGLVAIPIIRAIEPPCPPKATCDGAGLLTFLSIVVAGIGAAVAASGGLLVYFGRRH